MLYSFALMLSIMIAGAACLLVSVAVTHFFAEKANSFDLNREYVQAEVLRLSSRLTGMVGLYENTWRFNSQEGIPLARYAARLREHKGVTITGTDLTSTPFLLAATPAMIRDEASFNTLLHIVRRMSAAPAFDPTRDITVTGFIYSSDQSFVAAAPAGVPPFDETSARREGAEAFIRSLTTPAEAAIARDKLLCTPDLSWFSFFDSINHQWLAQIALPVFHDGVRVAALIARIPVDQFVKYFLRPDRPSTFFVLHANGVDALSAAPITQQDRDLLQLAQSQHEALSQITSDRKTIRVGLNFIIAQRVDGPNWLTIYVLGWRDLLAGALGSVAGAITVFIAALILLWRGVVYFDKRIAQPFERDALKLIEAEAFNRSVIDTAPVGIAVFDPLRGEIVQENAVVRRLLWGAAAESNAAFYREAIMERANMNAHAPAQLNQHSFLEIPWVIDHRTIHLGAALSNTRLDGRDVILLGLIDITEQKAAEAMLVRMQQATDKASREKSMFMAMIGHEIRTPLHGATGHLELLANSHLDDEQRQRIALVQRSFDTLLTLVNDLLETTRIEANALAINPQPAHVNHVVEHCAQLFSALAQEKGIAISCYTDPALDQALEADDHRLLQILQNLVSNAVKFTQHGSITLSSHLLREDNTYVWTRFDVADTGVGIPSALQALVFKPLTQADISVSRRYGGSGLGLFLCRGLAEAMGGTIALHSEPGYGSMFSIELPLRRLAPAQRPQPHPLNSLAVHLQGFNLRQAQMLSGRIANWGGVPRVLSHGMTESPDILVVNQSSPQQSAESGHHAPRLGTIMISTEGPLAPRRTGRVCMVSAYSSDALLAALLDLSQAGGNTSAAGATTDIPIVPRDILVAEDDPVSRTLLLHQLQALGLTRVRTAVDGQQALNMWLESPPDVLITDLGMPYLDGKGLLAEVRRHNPDAYVIAITAADTEEIQSHAEGAEFSAVLHKPVRLTELRGVLTSAQAPTTRQADTGRESLCTAETQLTELDILLGDAFRKNWKADREAVFAALISRDGDRARRRLHRLQGALLAIDLQKQAGECVALQELCISGNWDEAQTRFDALVADVSALIG